jgi:two-component system chemotaxis response regulator CheB
MGKKIRVIVVDDSALMRKKIGEILNADSDIEVVAFAKDGKEALEAVHALKPDVVTLDVEMPILNGIETLGYIMSEIPTPCVMISAFTKAGAAETIKALEFGAIEFVEKPSGVISPDIAKKSREIIEKVKVAANVPASRLKVIMPEKAKEERLIVKKAPGINRLIAIASSTGGTQALTSILPRLRADIPAGIVITQHMPSGFTKSLAERLNWQSKISVVEAEDRMPIKPGHAILARGGFHLEVAGTADAPHVLLNDGPPRLNVRPCADIMMESAARIFGDRTIGVVLTGMGSDGTLGSKAIKAEGGVVIAEDQDSCVVYGMPKSIIDSRLADKVLRLDDIPSELEKMVMKNGTRK